MKFPTLITNTELKIQGTQRIPSKTHTHTHTHTPTLRHIIFKGDNLEISQRKNCLMYLLYRETEIRNTAGRRSQDGGVGRQGVGVDPQLGRLPAAGGEL